VTSWCKRLRLEVFRPLGRVRSQAGTLVSPTVLTTERTVLLNARKWPRR
jgi:hypothetical protein